MFRGTSLQPHSEESLQMLHALLPPQVAAALAAVESLEQYGPESLLFAERHPPPGVFLVRSGEVKLSVACGRRSYVMRLAGSGDLLGLGAVVSNSVSEVTARALTECHVSVFERGDFLKVLQQHPESWIAISMIMSRELGHAYEQLRSMRNE